MGHLARPTATALQWQAPPNFNAPPSSSLGLHLVIMTCDVTQSGLESACEAPRTSVVSNPPAKVATALGSEASEPIGSGMDALNGKLVGVEEEKLAGRVVELWGFFWDQLLPRRRGARVCRSTLLCNVNSMSRCRSLSRPIRFYPLRIACPRRVEISPQQDKMGKTHPFLHIHHLPTLTSGLSPCGPSRTK